MKQPLLLILMCELVTLVLSVCMFAQAFAGQLEDADAALNSKDYATALQLLRPLAEQGGVKAQLKLSDMYEKGLGVPKDHIEAIQWKNKAGDAIVASVMEQATKDWKTSNPLNEPYDAYQHNDYATALRLFRPLADQGNAWAQYYMGMMYARGKAIPQDYTEAAKWFRKAAVLGLADAQNSLGHIYYSGEGVTQNYAEAEKWYRKAAAQGNTDARKALNETYKADGTLKSEIDRKANWYRDNYATIVKMVDDQCNIDHSGEIELCLQNEAAAKRAMDDVIMQQELEHKSATYNDQIDNAVREDDADMQRYGVEQRQEQQEMENQQREREDRIQGEENSDASRRAQTEMDNMRQQQEQQQQQIEEQQQQMQQQRINGGSYP